MKSLRLIDDEVLFRDTPDRKSIFPILFPVIWSEYYKKLQGSVWTAEEITFKDDISQIRNGEVSENIMNVVKFVLGFFSGADTIVNENLAENFLREIKIMEAQFFYGQQIQNENVHNETYARTIEAFYRDDKECMNSVFNAINTMPCVKKLFDWSTKWIHRTPEQELNSNPILKLYSEQGADDEVLEDLAKIWCTAKKLVAFGCVEGIMFSAAFCVIFWIKEQGLLPGLTFSNELISRDEGLHRDFACTLYDMIGNKPPVDQMTEIIRDAVLFKKEFVTEMLGNNQLTGLNCGLMNQYVEFVADNLSERFKFGKIYDSTCPFPFMEKISFNGMTNFFERRVGEYGASGFEQGHNEEIVLDEDY